MKNQRTALSGLLIGALVLGSCMAPTGTTVPPPANPTTKYVTLSAPASHSLSGGTLTATIASTTYGGHDAPLHFTAVWVETSAGAFVRTLGLWGDPNIYNNYLKAWKVSRGATAVDVTAGATLFTHGTETVTWDLTDLGGNPVPAGTYRLRAEMNESSASSKTDEVSLTLTSP